jgi:hypothetical protein
MSEKRLVVDQLKFAYTGLFDLPGLYKLIDSFFYEKGYDKRESMNSEQVMPDGRDIYLELMPFKSITDYFKMQVKIRLHVGHMKKLEIDRDGAKVPINEGELSIVFDGYLQSDRQGRWNNTPVQWFIRTIFDKYIFKGHFVRAEQWVVSDIDDLYKRITAFLNTYRGRERNLVAGHIM